MIALSSRYLHVLVDMVTVLLIALKRHFKHYKNWFMFFFSFKRFLIRFTLKFSYSNPHLCFIVEGIYSVRFWWAQSIASSYMMRNFMGTLLKLICPVEVLFQRFYDQQNASGNSGKWSIVGVNTCSIFQISDFTWWIFLWLVLFVAFCTFLSHIFVLYKRYVI